MKRVGRENKADNRDGGAIGMSDREGRPTIGIDEYLQRQAQWDPRFN